MLYPIFVFKTDSGTYDGYFPDVGGCFFAGDTLEDLLKNAEASFALHMEVWVERGGHVPAPSDPARYLGDERLALDDGYLAFIDLDPAKYEPKAIKFNLTMPSNLLTAIDRYIQKNGQYKNRSAFIAELARKEIAKNQGEGTE